jgi:hypothetical protein
MFQFNTHEGTCPVCQPGFSRSEGCGEGRHSNHSRAVSRTKTPGGPRPEAPTEYRGLLRWSCTLPRRLKEPTDNEAQRPLGIASHNAFRPDVVIGDYSGVGSVRSTLRRQGGSGTRRSGPSLHSPRSLNQLQRWMAYEDWSMKPPPLRKGCYVAILIARRVPVPRRKLFP